MPKRIAVSSERSAAKKFGTLTRIHTPSVNGTHINATNCAVCFKVLCGNSSKSRNVFDRASELDTAAATPSSTSSVIKISDVVTGFTPLLYRAGLHGLDSTPRNRRIWSPSVHSTLRIIRIMPFTSLRQLADADFPTRWGHFRILGFEGVVENPTPCNAALPPPTTRTESAVALIMGDLAPMQDGTVPPIMRIHSQCLTGDVFHSLRCDCRQQLELALAAISTAGAGILLYEDQEGRGIGLMAKLQAYELQDQGRDTIEANLELGYAADCRHFELPAAILKLLKIPAVRLITNNPAKVDALESAGIKVVERINADVAFEPTNAFYLQTKRDKMGHLVG
jgi:GTP cyclohydrolase II